ncbi:MAG TPA: PspA/IM30 family protein [Methylomirabilota bacterium]|nr:PspA/IM30 family protein [Methylomirabilota bacterium]
MLGFTNRFSTLLKQKVNTLLDRYEDPKEALDYSYIQQVETLNRLRRNIAEVVTAKKRLEMQKMRLWDNVRNLDEQAHRAVDSNREDLAKLALERKNANLLQVQGLDKQITEMQAEQQKLEDTEKRLSTKVEEFKSKKEVIKAQYSAAEAQVRIKENVTGISEEMTDVGMAMSRAEDKTEKMKAKAQALDEMIDSGVLTDYTLTSSTTGSDNDIEGELQKMTVKSSVEEELAKLKAANAKKKKNQPEGQEEQNKEESRVEEEEQPVVA